MYFLILIIAIIIAGIILYHYYSVPISKKITEIKINRIERYAPEDEPNRIREYKSIMKDKYNFKYWKKIYKPVLKKYENYMVGKNKIIEGIPREQNRNIINDIQNYEIEPGDVEEPNYQYVPEVIYNDSQNTHDHGVVETAKKSLENIEKENITTTPNNTENLKKELLNLIEKSDMTEVRKNNIIKTIRNFDNSPLSSLNKSPNEVISLVAPKILKSKEAKEMFINNMKDAINPATNKPYCVTGVTERILGSLDGIDESVNIKPTWALKQELINRGSVLSREYEAKSKDDQSDEKANYIRKILLNEYKNIASEKEINKELDEWINFI